jgi:dienelactone hydrolase
VRRIQRTTVRIATTSDDLEAWFYEPDGQGPHPTVVMGHGLGAVKAGGLAPFADRFCAEGFAVVAIDTTGVQRAVDVGAAHGGLLRLLQQSNPALRGVIFDRPDVLESARAEVVQAGFPTERSFSAVTSSCRCRQATCTC